MILIVPTASAQAHGGAWRRERVGRIGALGKKGKRDACFEARAFVFGGLRGRCRHGRAGSGTVRRAGRDHRHRAEAGGIDPGRADFGFRAVGGSDPGSGHRPYRGFRDLAAQRLHRHARTARNVDLDSRHRFGNEQPRRRSGCRRLRRRRLHGPPDDDQQQPL